jgi:hypothetical protein
VLDDDDDERRMERGDVALDRVRDGVDGVDLDVKDEGEGRHRGTAAAATLAVDRADSVGYERGTHGGMKE